MLKLDEDGSLQQVTEFRDGEIIGESSLLEEQSGTHRRSATIVAKTPCKLLRVTRKAMVAIVDRYPDIRQHLQEVHDRRVGD